MSQNLFYTKPQITVRQHFASLPDAFLMLVGAVFLLSGFSKAVDGAYFSNIISSYGFDALRFTAPFIILAEVLLGLGMVFLVKARTLSVAGIILTIVFTGAYLYGWLIEDVQDCGCFGRLRVLGQSPAVILGKNFVIVALLSYVAALGDNGYKHRPWVSVFVLVTMVTAAYLTGHTSSRDRTSKSKAVSIPFSESGLNRFVALAPDSSYYVFVFSYACPHCLNSIANLKEYTGSNAVDKVVGLALGNKGMERVFTESFYPNFEIHNYGAELLDFTNEFPKGFLVRNDTIVMEMEGDLPCRPLFDDLIIDLVH